MQDSWKNEPTQQLRREKKRTFRYTESIPSLSSSCLDARKKELATSETSRGKTRSIFAARPDSAQKPVNICTTRGTIPTLRGTLSMTIVREEFWPSSVSESGVYLPDLQKKRNPWVKPPTRSMLDPGRPKIRGSGKSGLVTK